MLPPVMAVNGPPNPEAGSGLDFTLSPDPQHSPPVSGVDSPLLPEPPQILSPGPVSPTGKKRVRISDSTSVRVIEEEDHHHHHHHHQRQQQHQHRGFQFSEADSRNNRVHAASSTSSPRSRRELKFSEGGADCVRGKKKGGGGGGSSPEARGEYNGDFDDGEYRREYHRGSPPEYTEYTEYTESLCAVDQLTFPEDVPTPVVKR